MVDRGAMTPNEWRETMNMTPIPGGDQPIRRLDTQVVNLLKELLKQNKHRKLRSYDTSHGHVVKRERGERRRNIRSI